MASYFHFTVPLQHRSPLSNSRITRNVLLINSNKFTFQMNWKLLSKISVGELHRTVRTLSPLIGICQTLLI